MTQSVRDQFRLRSRHALRFYQWQVAPRLRRDRRVLELARWAASGSDLLGRLGAHGIRVERDGVWIDDGDGCLWAYVPGPFSSTLWAEVGAHYEASEIQQLAGCLPADGTLVDVGANIGLHAVKLAAQVSGLRVLAFEPVAETFALLQRNAVKNGVADRIEAQRLAISDHVGEIRITTRFQAGNFVVPDGTNVAEGVAELVPCRPLDDIIRERGGRVDAIKCDVEGAELAVIRGARETLERFKPAILMEVDQRWTGRYGHSGVDVFSSLTGLGYAYSRFVGGELRPASGSVQQDLQEGSNFLFSAL